MKHLVFFAIFLSGHISLFSQKMSFKVQYSEPLAVFEFVIDLSNNSGPNANKSAFINSEYNAKPYLDLLAEFAAINYFYWYEYPAYPYGNKIGGNTYFLLCKNLIESNSIRDFSSKSLGIIPNADLSALTNILSQFVPVYRALVYKPYELIIMSQMQSIEEKIRETNVSLFVDQVIKFHNSSWDVSTPFTLNVCPSPASDGISAFAFFNYAYIRLPVNQKDIALFLSFMFHESFHVIFDEQPLIFKRKLAAWFNENPSKYSRYAESLFNEAIATALSSGYLYRNLKGSELPPDKWYVNKYISKMAFEIAPLTEKYINEGKQIDKTFIDEYIKIYGDKFPEWLYDIDNLMGERFIISDNPANLKTVSEVFPHRSIREAREEINHFTIEEIKKHPITKVIVVSKNNKRSLELIKSSFRELGVWKPDIMSNFAYSIFLSDKTYLIILNIPNGNLQQLLKNIKVM